MKKSIFIVLTALAFIFFALYLRMDLNTEPKNSNVIWIGLDGAAWKIVDKLLKDGTMPNLNYFIKNGCSGVLNIKDSGDSSPEIWTSMATGKSPSEHAINGFRYFDKSQQKSTLFRSFNRKQPAFWNFFSSLGLKVSVINWLMADPPEKINGLNITNLLWNIQTNPEDYMNKIQPLLPANISNSDDKIETYYYELNLLTDLAKKIISEEKPQVLALYLRSLDLLQHKYWKYYEPEYFTDAVWNIDKDTLGNYQKAIPEYYQNIDTALFGMIRSQLDENTVLIINSDHGFQKSNPLQFFDLDINRILRILDILKYKDNSERPDIEKSLAYDMEANGRSKNSRIYISSSSTLSVHDIQLRILTALSELKLAETDENLFTEVSIGPDNKVILKENWDLRSKINLDGQDQEILIGDEIFCYSNDIFDFRNVSGTHDTDALFIVYGKKIRKNTQIKADSLDILPTVLHILDLPRADDMPGKILKRIFKRYKKSKKHISSYKDLNYGKEKEQDKSLIDDENRLKNLRSLGYIK